MIAALFTIAGAVIIGACAFALGITWAAIKTNWEDDDHIP
jgi:hypothetical protein